MTAVKKVNLTIPQGTLYTSTVNSEVFSVFISNTSDYTYKGEVRKYYDSNSYFSFDFSSNTDTITYTVGANTTLAFEPGRYMYDIMAIQKSGNNGPYRLQEGVVTLTSAITHTYANT